jgi:hypothetical protein
VYYVLGINGKYETGQAVVNMLIGQEPPKEERVTTRSKDVIYMERIGQAPISNAPMLRKLKARAEKRAMELNRDGKP